MSVYVVLVQSSAFNGHAGVPGVFSSKVKARGWLLENGYNESMEEGTTVYRRPVSVGGSLAESDPPQEEAGLLELELDSLL